MLNKNLLANVLMLITALIWGGAFVAQRTGMDAIGPLLFSGLRFSLGAAVIFPFLLYRRQTARVQGQFLDTGLLSAGLLLGLLVTLGINLQQVGLLFTKVSNAGFITGIYVVLVPILGLLFGLRAGWGIWLGASLTVGGLALLSIQENLSIASGDWLQLTSALTWALHVLALGYFAQRYDPLRLAFLQFVICALLSLVAAYLFEPILWPKIRQAMPALAYAGVLSVGVGFSLQAIAQRHVKPAHAAIILSLEGVFAAVAATLLLGETLSGRAYVGAALILTGMLIAQLWPQNTTKEVTHLPGPHP